MGRITVLGDIHSLSIWKDIVKKNKNSDKIIFLGDYLDPYGIISNEDQVNNLLEIINLKKENPEQVILLLGNHDCHYFTDNKGRSTRFNWEIAKEVEGIFIENLSLFQYFYLQDKYLFSHAGVDEYWFKGSKYETIEALLNCNNHSSINNSIYNIGYMRGGRCPIGGPLWIDSDEIRTPVSGYTQIVGHNQFPTITYKNYSNGGTVIFCDCFQKSNSYLNLYY